MDKIKEMLGICMEDDDAKTVAPTITSQRDAQPTHEHTAPLHHQEEHEEQKSKLPSALESRKKVSISLVPMMRFKTFLLIF